ncbi:hypothetical protein BC832DRAFT_589511 [Gaertneriomyces semiglobifer]|nr:hypothetical protein BC832DRAFT_589511 [Gaertneriomyces semiglobifer]
MNAQQRAAIISIARQDASRRHDSRHDDSMLDDPTSHDRDEPNVSDNDLENEYNSTTMSGWVRKLPNPQRSKANWDGAEMELRTPLKHMQPSVIDASNGYDHRDTAVSPAMSTVSSLGYDVKRRKATRVVASRYMNPSGASAAAARPVTSSSATTRRDQGQERQVDRLQPSGNQTPAIGTSSVRRMGMAAPKDFNLPERPNGLPAAQHRAESGLRRQTGTVKSFATTQAQSTNRNQPPHVMRKDIVAPDGPVTTAEQASRRSTLHLHSSTSASVSTSTAHGRPAPVSTTAHSTMNPMEIDPYLLETRLLQLTFLRQKHEHAFARQTSVAHAQLLALFSRLQAAQQALHKQQIAAAEGKALLETHSVLAHIEAYLEKCAQLLMESRSGYDLLMRHLTATVDLMRMRGVCVSDVEEWTRTLKTLRTADVQIEGDIADKLRVLASKVVKTGHGLTGMLDKAKDLKRLEMIERSWILGERQLQSLELDAGGSSEGNI